MISLHSSCALIFFSTFLKIFRFVIKKVEAVRFFLKRSRKDSAEHGKLFNTIPGPFSIPCFGVVHHFFPCIGKFSYRMSALEFSETLNSSYGDIVRFPSMLGKNPTVFIMTPELAEEVYKEQLTGRDLLESMVYFRRQIRHDEFQGHHGVLASDGAEWKAMRRATDFLMLSERAINTHRQQINNITDEAIHCIETAWMAKTPEKFSDSLYGIVRGWAFETLAHATYGRRLGALDESSLRRDRCDGFLASLNQMLDSIFSLEFGLPFWKYFSTTGFKRAVVDYDRHLKFVQEFAIASGHHKQLTRKDQESECLLHRMTRVAPSMALGVTNDIMLAGIDTVAQTTISILYVLACNAREQDKLREQLRSEGGDRRYLRACIKEALRVLPTTGGNYRTTSRDITVGGYHIPKNVDVVLCHQYMSAQERQFLRAREFLPERWITRPTESPAESVAPAGAHPSAFLPFGAGARACHGRTLANLELECFIEQFVSRFRVKWDAPPPRFANPTVNFLLPPYRFVFERVSDAQPACETKLK